MRSETLDISMKILDVLASGHSASISINELTLRIKARHGRAHYHSIYNAIKHLDCEGVILLERIGKATVPKLNFQSHLLLDSLTMLEIKKKQDLLTDYPDIGLPLESISGFFRELHYIRSVSVIGPEKNKKLNRLELLIILKDGAVAEEKLCHRDEKHIISEILGVNRQLQTLQKRHNIRIDPLILNTSEFRELASSQEINPLQNMLSDMITIVSPEGYWTEIKGLKSKGIQTRVSDRETTPAQITEQELVYNLARFGYREFGRTIRPRSDICLEFVITAILQQNNIRAIEATPALLAKNDTDVNYRVLIFLCQKYNLSGKLLDLLHKLNEVKPTEKTSEAITILESVKTEAKETVDRDAVMEKMKLYNAI